MGCPESRSQSQDRRPATCLGDAAPSVTDKITLTDPVLSHRIRTADLMIRPAPSDHDAARAFSRIIRSLHSYHHHRALQRALLMISSLARRCTSRAAIGIAHRRLASTAARDACDSIASAAGRTPDPNPPRYPPANTKYLNLKISRPLGMCGRAVAAGDTQRSSSGVSGSRRCWHCRGHCLPARAPGRVPSALHRPAAS